MYLDFFKLKAEPFGITPDPDFLFLSPSHKEALASIIYGVRMRKGFIAVTGEAGVGKTTVIRSYLDSQDGRSVRVVYLFNSNVTFQELLNAIFRELGITPETGGVSGMIDQLHRELIEYYNKNVNVVLIVDEAQNMPPGTLEKLRMLSNLETTKEKLIQIIFSGQPEFDRLLARSDLRQLRQRIAVKVTIRRLSSAQSRAYIRHRVSRASASEAPLFTYAAIHAIAGRAKGIPRTINILCGNSLVTAFGYNKRHIGYSVAREAVSDMDGVRRSSPVVAYGGALLTLLVVLAAVFFVPRAVSEVSSLVHDSVPAITGRLAQLQGSATGEKAPHAPQGRAAEKAARPVLREGKTDADAPAHELAGQAAAAPERTRVETRVANKGDTLTSMAVSIYGFASDEIIDSVARTNPGIKDVNVIYEGDTIAFPVGRPPARVPASKPHKPNR